MKRRVCSWVVILTTLLNLLWSWDVQAAEKKQMRDVDQIEFTHEGSYKKIVRHVYLDNKFDVILKNDGVFPIRMRIKYNYLDTHSCKKVIHHSNQLVQGGEQLAIYDLQFKKCERCVWVKIKLTSCRKKCEWFGDLSPYTKGAEGMLTLIQTKKDAIS